MSTLCRAFVLAAVAVSFAPDAGAEEIRESHHVLGRTLDVAVASADSDWGHERIAGAIAVARRLEAQLVASDDSSDVAKLNQSAGAGARVVPLDLYRLLALSRVMTRSTGDAFDVTVGPLIKRRASDREGGRAVEEALWLVGSEKVVLRPPNRVELPEPGMSIDFSAILPGYVLERMAASMRDGGVTKALLAFEDGTHVAIGPPAGEEPFRVPVPRGRAIAGSIALRDRAVATLRARPRGSDDADPRRAIVDPRSGRVVEGERQSTVVARDAAIAAAWSTALVVDPDGALVLLDEPRDVEALVFDEHGEHASPRFVEFAGWKPARASDLPRVAGGRREADPDGLEQ